MDNLPKVNQEMLILSFQKEGFATQVFSQLQKEFEKIGIALELALADYSSYAQFSQSLANELSLLLEHSPTLFQQLLYLIDLPENQVQDALLNAPNPTLEISRLLLIRVAKKVFYRDLYKQGKL